MQQKWISEKEAQYTQSIVDELKKQSTLSALYDRLKNDDLLIKHPDFFFEARFAYVATKLGFGIEYEVPGPNGSHCDFEITSGAHKSFVECYSFGTTDNVNSSTYQSSDGTSYAMTLDETGEGKELWKCVLRICKKLLTPNGSPSKFYSPSNNATNVLLVDIRKAFVSGGDIDDHRQTAFGSMAGKSIWTAIREDGEPFTGVFDEKTTAPGAHLARERVHFLALSNEKTYGVEDFCRQTTLFANPFLFSDKSAAKAAVNLTPFANCKIEFSNAHR